MKFGMAAAIGLTVIAFMFEDKKRNLLCLLFICIASLFHISALLALVYFVVRKVSVTKQVFLGQDGDERYWKYYKAIFLSAVLLPIVRINLALFRIYTYFSIYEGLFIPLMLSKIDHRMIKAIGYMGYFGVYLYLFFTQSAASSLKATPYMFF